MKLFCYDPAVDCEWGGALFCVELSVTPGNWTSWFAMLCGNKSYNKKQDRLLCYVVQKWVMQQEEKQVVIRCCVEMSHATGSRTGCYAILSRKESRNRKKNRLLCDIV